MGESGGGKDDSFLDALNPARMIQSLFVQTDFESRSHEDMLRMIEAADPGKTEQLGDKLVRAAKTIDKIGQDLKDHAPRVVWEGEGSEAFRVWSTSMSSATLRLGEFSKGAGEAMKNAAQTLREVKRDMPSYSSAAAAKVGAYVLHNPGGMADLQSGPQPSASPGGARAKDRGGPSRTDAYNAQQKLTEDHGEAVRQMRKLAQSYTLTGMTMTGGEQPTFPPMPRALMPPKMPHDVRVPARPGDREAATQGAAPAYQSEVGTAQSADSHGRTGRQEPSALAVPGADRQVGTEIAGGVRMPEAPTTPPPSSPPPAPGPAPVLGGPPGPVNMPPRSPESTNRPKGSPRTPLGRSPVQGGPPQSGPPRTRTPADTGIHGGRPSQTGTGQPARGIPRGPVVGGEPRQGSGPMGRAGGPGGMARPGGVAQQGVFGGRPMASQPGGRLGNAQQRAITSTGRPFTPGGTGLVRGAGPAGSRRDPRDRAGDTAGRRPDYLVEDEETWAPRTGGRVAPPVIE